MRTHSTTKRLLGLGAALVSAATLALGGAGSVDAATFTASGNSSSSQARVSAEAKAAGQQAFGDKASEQQALEAYWSPERMRSAKPVEDTDKLKSAAAAYESKQRADQKAGKKPTTNDGALRQVEGAASKVFAGPGTPKTSAYDPNLPYYVPTAYTMGKLFFSKGDGNYVCSATIVNTEGKDTVWTAGHCLYTPGEGWHWNVSFVPAYDDDLANPRPYGTWTANHLWSRTAWMNNSDFSQDIGVVIMNPNWGWHIVDYFGGQGFTVNRGKSGVWENAFGYPSEWPFDGGNLMRCWGSTSPEWDAWLFWSQTVKIPCDMTRGSSGGAWLYGYDGNYGYLNGVNSRIDRIVGPTIMLSPYFDDDAWSLFQATRYI